MEPETKIKETRTIETRTELNITGSDLVELVKGRYPGLIQSGDQVSVTVKYDYMDHEIDKHMPIVAIAPHDSYYEKTLSNIEEIRAREGLVIGIGDEKD